jgi:hypothetical protein
MSVFVDALPPPVLEFIEAAITAGILVKDGDGRVHIAVSGTDPSLHSQVERAANLLDGSWLELAVLDFVNRSPHFTDAHWSVEPRRHAGAAETASFGETDIVCLRLPAGSLEVISCKTTIEKPLEHLEALRERSTHLGGRYARAALALLFASPAQETDLRRWGRLVDVDILIGEEIRRLAG